MRDRIFDNSVVVAARLRTDIAGDIYHNRKILALPVYSCEDRLAMNRMRNADFYFC